MAPRPALPIGQGEKMNYPFLLFSEKISLRPVFTGLVGDPYVADLSRTSPLLEGLAARDQRQFQAVLAQRMGTAHSWGVSPYLERRDTLLGDCPQMAAEERFIHLGLDVIVPLGTPLHAPLDAVVEQSGYESGEGNYGGFVLLRHENPAFEPFFSFYGHLCKDRLPTAGNRFAAGERFAEIGDFHENGNWFHHTHFQVITEKGLAAGYAAKGYCTAGDLVEMNDLCPSPIPFFRR
jgi:murein DD-endopeptidase MepM/ murein hydrolase activator NlpD